MPIFLEFNIKLLLNFMEILILRQTSSYRSALIKQTECIYRVLTDIHCSTSELVDFLLRAVGPPVDREGLEGRGRVPL